MMCDGYALSQHVLSTDLEKIFDHVWLSRAFARFYILSRPLLNAYLFFISDRKSALFLYRSAKRYKLIIYAYGYHLSCTHINTIANKEVHWKLSCLSQNQDDLECI